MKSLLPISRDVGYRATRPAKFRIVVVVLTSTVRSAIRRRNDAGQVLHVIVDPFDQIVVR